MDNVIPSPRPVIANAAWKSLLSGRPRLWGPAEDVRRRAGERPDLYEVVRGQDTLMSAGVVHIVEGLPPDKIDRFIDQALNNVARGATNVHQDTWIWMAHVAMVYDLFHDRLAQADRGRMIDWLNANFESFRDDENAFHNSTFAKMHTYLQIAYATWGDNPKAQAFRDHAIEFLYRGRVVPVLKAFGAGGGHTECGWYCRGSIWMLVAALEWARRVEGYDGFAEQPAFFYHRMAYNLLETYPGYWQGGRERYSCEGDGHNLYSQAMEYPRLTRNLLATYFRGSELAAYVSARRNEPNPQWMVYDLLYDAQPDAPADLFTFPTAHLSAGIGKLHARGDWSDSASWMRFECGPFWNQHQHQEAGNFEIFRREPLATESGEYIDWSSPHALNWLVRTIAHNCILVNMPGERFRNIRNWQNIDLANDGGQGPNVYVCQTLEEWQASRADHERGQVFAYENRGPLLYVAGDCTKAYSARKVTLCCRHIVFIRPHLFIVLDRVHSTQAEYEKTWLLHCMNEPELGEASAVIVNGPGHLAVRTLLPERATMRKVYGYTYGGQTFDIQASRITPTAEKWRIEVRPPTPSCEDVFLHVLSTDGDVQARVIRDGESIGAAGDGWQVLLDPAGRGSVTIGNVTFALEPTVKLGKYET